MGNINLHQVIVEQLFQDQPPPGLSNDGLRHDGSDGPDDSLQLSITDPDTGRGSDDIDVESVSEQEVDVTMTPGLPQAGSKPSPMTMVNNVARTTTSTAPVPPQASPSSNHGNGSSSTASNSTLNATRQSSFAAALRKLAKQAGDPDPGDQVSPGSTSSQSGPSSRDRPHSRDHSGSKSGAVSSGSSSNHGNPRPSGSVSGSQAASTLNSAPVVTVAPTPSHRPYLDTGGRKNPDVSSSAESLPTNIKQEHDKMAALPPLSHDRLRDDDVSHNSKEAMSVESRLAPRMAPHAGLGAVSSANHEDITRGFQPYRPGEDLSNRHQMAAQQYPSHFQSSTMDPMYSAAMQAYHSMMQPHPYAAHPAYRMEDPMLLERYRMLQQGQMYSYGPGMVAASAAAVHPYLAAMGAARYPSDILTQQHMSYLASMSAAAAAAKPPDHVSPGSASDRPKSTEEQRRERDKDREKEREREREEHHRQDRERDERERRDRDRSSEKHSRDNRSNLHHHHHQHQHHSNHHTTPPHTTSSSSENHQPHHHHHHRHRSEQKSPSSANSKRDERQPPNHAVSPSGRDSIHYFSAEKLLAPSASSSSSRQTSSTAAGYNRPVQDQPLNLHKADEAVAAGAGAGAGPSGPRDLYLEKERERKRMHQEFLRKQDMLMQDPETPGTSHPQDKTPPSTSTPSSGFHPYSHHNVNKSPSVTSAPHSKSPVTLSIPKIHSHHQGMIKEEKAPDGSSRAFYRPFEGKNSLLSSSGNVANGLEKDLSECDRRLISERTAGAVMVDKIDQQAMRNSFHPNNKSFSGSSKSDNFSSVSAERSRHPPPEGIQARLLDCHQVEPLPSNQLHPLERLLSKHSQKVTKADTMKDNHVIEPALVSSKPSSQIISKLDLEERLLRQFRQAAGYNSDMSEEGSDEEADAAGINMESISEKHRRLLVIASGPPLELDTNRTKLKYLERFGLTTHQTKKDEEYKRHLKRRKIYHDRSTSPIEVENRRSHSPLVLPSSAACEDIACAPDHRHRSRFLAQLFLEPVQSERRHELEMIRRVCDWDNSRRNGHKDLPLPLMSLENHFLWYQRLVRPQPISYHGPPPPGGSTHTPSNKRKYESPDYTLPHKRPTTDELPDFNIPLSAIKQEPGISRGLAVSSPTTSSSSSGITPPQTRSSLWRPNSSAPSAFSVLSAVSGSAVSTSSQDSERKSTSTVTTAPVTTAPPQQPDKDHARRAISREFAQEFHESVLQTTRQQQQQEPTKQQSSSSSVEVHYTLDHDAKSVSPGGSLSGPSPSPVSIPSTQPLGATRGMSLPPGGQAAAEASRRAEVGGGEPLHWPGIQCLLESHQRYNEEQTMEQQILKDQCAHLQQESLDLNRTAERLSRKMAELLQNKQSQEEERFRVQTKLDNLNKSLRILR